MRIVEKFFLFKAAREDRRPFLNGHRSVPFRSNEFLDGLRQVVEGITFSEDSILGEGDGFSNTWSAGEQFLPVGSGATDFVPLANRGEFGTVGNAAGCLGILAVARMLRRGRAQGGGVGIGLRAGLSHGRTNGSGA